jgi:hypothetical protein
MLARWRWMALGMALFAAAPRTAHAQSRSVHVETHNGTRHEVSVTGTVEFAEDERSVARISPAGRLVVEEARRGQPTRRVVWTGVGDRVRRAYYENDEPRTPDAAALAWIDRQIQYTVRETAIGAGPRVARIRARRGVAGVLEEIARIESDGTKRIYYKLLLDGGLSADETARVVRHAGQTVGSDGELRLVLSQAMRGERLGAAGVAAVVDAAAEIGSDGEKSLVLREVARGERLDDPRVRAAFFRTAGSIGSDGERALVLRQAAGHAMADAASRDGFFRAAAGIDSDGEKAIVLRTVLRQSGLRADGAVAALRVARTIDSDGEKSIVLRAVPASLLRDAAVQAAYLEALRTIDGEGERSVAAAHLARNRS